MPGLAITCIELSTVELMVNEGLICHLYELMALWEAACLWSTPEDYEQFSWPLICPRGLLWHCTLDVQIHDPRFFFIQLEPPETMWYPHTQVINPIG